MSSYAEKAQKLLDDIESGVFLRKEYSDLNSHADEIISKLDNESKEIINKWYDSYERSELYSPTHSFEKAYKILNKAEEDFEIKTDDPSLIPENERVSGDYIYNRMFVEGWHGGDKRGLIQYTTPPVAYDGGFGDNGKMKPFENKKGVRWKMATKGFSPKNEIDKMYKDYINGDEYGKFIQQAFDNAKNSYGI